jgi:hypothetical protein
MYIEQKKKARNPQRKKMMGIVVNTVCCGAKKRNMNIMTDFRFCAQKQAVRTLPNMMKVECDEDNSIRLKRKKFCHVKIFYENGILPCK